MVKRPFQLLMLFCLLLGSYFSASAANISISVNRDPVQINESFKIIIEADDRVSDEPDLSPLQQDFEILSRSRSSDLQYFNGQTTYQTRWTLSVMAKRTGLLTIPSIQVGNDHSSSMTVTIKKQIISPTTRSTADKTFQELFIETSASPTTLYVQSQIIYTIRIFRAVQTSGLSISEPQVSGGEVVIEQLGGDTRFETERDGRRYAVIERKYAIFPQQSGKLTIEAMNLDAQVVQRRAGMFDPFGQNTVTKRLKSEAIELDVRAIPAKIKSPIWLPTSKLQLTEKWSDDTFVVGEPVTRTLTIKAEGLTAAQLPSLDMGSSRHFKSYPDQPRMNDKRGNRGISGTRQEKIAIIPTQAGEFTLPALEIPWWNVNSHQLEIAKLPARTINVKPGAQTNTAPPTPTVSPVQTEETTTFITEQKQPIREKIIYVDSEEKGLWFTVAIILGTGWLLTLLAWLFRTRANKNGITTPIVHPRSNLNQVKKACHANNAPATQAALLGWAKAHWPDKPPTNLGDIGKRLGPDIAEKLKRLDSILYGSEQQSWQAEGLAQQIEIAVKSKAQAEDGKTSLIVPLYP